MPYQEFFISMMKALDIRKSMTVVVYDTGKGWFSARANFMLRAFGHPKVYMLDGGFTKWKSEGRKVEGDSSSASDFDYKLNESSIASYEQVVNRDQNT